MQTVQPTTKEQFLHGHTNEGNAYVVEDYPYGFRLRCKMRYWIESDARKGDRFCKQTTNPKAKTEVWNNPKKSTYSHDLIYMFLEAGTGHVNYCPIEVSSEQDKTKAMFTFLTDLYGIENIKKQKQEFIRVHYFMLLQGSYSYRAHKYSDEAREGFKQWTLDTQKYVHHCDFKAIPDHAPAPVPDCPDAPMKWTTTTYEITENGMKEVVAVV